MAELGLFVVITDFAGIGAEEWLKYEDLAVCCDSFSSLLLRNFFFFLFFSNIYISNEKNFGLFAYY